MSISKLEATESAGEIVAYPNGSQKLEQVLQKACGASAKFLQVMKIKACIVTILDVGAKVRVKATDNASDSGSRLGQCNEDKERDVHS